MLKAVIFDIDETLIDWSGFTSQWMDVERGHIQNVYRYIKKLTDDLPSENEFLYDYSNRLSEAWMHGRETLVAPNLGRLLVDTAIACGIRDDQVTIDECLKAYNWKVIEGTRLFPDVIPALEYLQGTSVKLGIITNSFHPMSLRDIELKAYGILKYFPDSRITAADAGYLKPHKGIFQHSLKELEVEPHEAIYVGDNLIADISGAQGAGMIAIQRRKPYVPSALLDSIKPDAAIDTFDELPDIIQRLFPDWKP